jgi:hypothetical protein
MLILAYSVKCGSYPLAISGKETVEILLRYFIIETGSNAAVRVLWVLNINFIKVPVAGV